MDKICPKRKGISNTSHYSDSHEEQKVPNRLRLFFFCESRGIPSDKLTLHFVQTLYCKTVYIRIYCLKRE